LPTNFINTLENTVNRYPSYQQPSLPTTRYEAPLLSCESLTATTLRIANQELDSGNVILLVPFTAPGGVVVPILFDEWTIDLTQTGLEFTTRTGGRLDGLALSASTYYHIWALADQSLNPQGFGLTAVPKSAFSITGGTKGSEATLTGLTSAYRFTIGAVVHVARSSTEFNKGVVISIESSTSIKVLMDNTAYGTDCSNGAGIAVTQMNRFRPYLPNSSAQETYHPYYRIVGDLRTSAASEIDYYDESLVQYAGLPLSSVIPWDPDIVTPSLSLPPGWHRCDGTMIDDIHSPLYGTPSREINTAAGYDAGRYPRGGGTSGVLQDATKYFKWTGTATGRVISASHGTGAYDADGLFTKSFEGRYINGGTNFGPVDISDYYACRPVSITMVMIQKTR
jgi:hypothetical protein